MQNLKNLGLCHFKKKLNQFEKKSESSPKNWEKCAPGVTLNGHHSPKNPSSQGFLGSASVKYVYAPSLKILAKTNE